METLLCLKLEFMKLRKSFFKFLFILPAIVSISMLSIGLYFKKSSFITYGNLHDDFSGLLLANHSMLFWNFILLLFVISISIALFYIETSNNSLTAICSSKLKRSSIYLSKWIFLILSTFLMIIIGVILLKVSSKIFNIPIKDSSVIVKYVCFEFSCSIGLISFQLFLTSILKSIETSTIISILAAVGFNAISIDKGIMPYIPYLYFANSTPFANTMLLRKTLVVSLAYCVIFLILGILSFKFKDIRE